MPARTPFSRRVAALRKAQKGRTQDEVAAAIGASRSTVAGWETGGDLPSREMLAALASYYGVSETWLLHGDDDDEAKSNDSAADFAALKQLWRQTEASERPTILRMLRAATTSPGDNRPPNADVPRAACVIPIGRLRERN